MKLRDKANTDVVKEALRLLHDAPTKACFKAGYALFMKMLNDLKEDELTTHFAAEYGGDHKINWAHCLFKPAVPTSNNGLESKNRVIKKNGTHRNRVQVTRLMVEVLPRWLSAESTIDINWQGEPALELHDWWKALLFVESPACTLAVSVGGVILVPSASTVGVVNKEVKKADKSAKVAELAKKFAAFMLKTKASSFGAWKKLAYMFYTLKKQPASFVGVARFDCSCPQYLHYKICKHALGWSVARKLVEVPTDKQLDQIGRVKTCGRPALAKRAWVKQ